MCGPSAFAEMPLHISHIIMKCMRVKMLPSLAPQYFRNFSVIVVKMQIEDAVGQKAE